MKRAVFYSLIFVIICYYSELTINNSIGQEVNNRSPYYLSFASIGANLLESRLDCWAKIKTINSAEDMSQTLLMVLNHLNLPADQNEFLHQETEELLITQYYLNYNGQSYYFMLQTNKLQKDSYLLMTVINSQNDQRLYQAEKNLEELYDCKAYYRFKGIINARPDHEGQEELLTIAMQNLQAEIKNIYRDEQMVSMTGFSAKLSQNYDSVYAAGTECNVQAAIRRNNAENKTEIYLGFPLLLNDY
jgi:Protein of unknown function (DUF1779).